jgi:hypothetical protein
MINDPDNAQDQGLTTEQIAAARPGQAQPVSSAPAGYDSYDDAAAPLDTGLTASEYPGRDGADAGYGDSAAAAEYTDRGAPDASYGDSVATDPGQHTSLLDDSELQTLTMRWKDIQAEFVDEPTTAVKEADALVAELMQRLAAMFASERHELENRWSSGSEVSTEDLRQGLRLYRSFFERLLAA